MPETAASCAGRSRTPGKSSSAEKNNQKTAPIRPVCAARKLTPSPSSTRTAQNQSTGSTLTSPAPARTLILPLRRFRLCLQKGFRSNVKPIKLWPGSRSAIPAGSASTRFRSSGTPVTASGKKFPAVYSPGSPRSSPTLRWNAVGPTAGGSGPWTEQATSARGPDGGTS